MDEKSIAFKRKFDTCDAQDLRMHVCLNMFNYENKLKLINVVYRKAQCAFHGPEVTMPSNLTITPIVKSDKHIT